MTVRQKQTQRNQTGHLATAVESVPVDAGSDPVGILSDRNVLVTGATGFIGSHLAERLGGEVANVRCLVRATSDFSHLGQSGVELVPGDLRDPGALGSTLDDVDTVFHVAGVTAAATRRGYFEGNALSTANLLRACLERRDTIRRFVYVSSIAAAGPSCDGLPLTEDCPPRPVSLYGQSKLQAERIVGAVRDRMPVTILRPPIVYGPCDRDLLKFFRLIARGILPQAGHRRRYVSLIYVDDLIEGLIGAATSETTAGQTYFLANPHAYERTEVAKAIAHSLGVPCPRPLALAEGALYAAAWIMELLQPVIRDPTLLSRDRVVESVQDHWTCSSARAEREFGFRPRFPLAEGIRRTTEWYRAQGWL